MSIFNNNSLQPNPCLDEIHHSDEIRHLNEIHYLVAIQFFDEIDHIAEIDYIDEVYQTVNVNHMNYVIHHDEIRPG